MAKLSVAIAMACSGIIMLMIAVYSYFNYEPAGNVISGLIIAILGFLVNTWFWRRYTRLNREQFDPVIAAQQNLYRAKAFVDLCVVSALTAVTVAPNHPVTLYVDIIGSIVVALYLIYSAIGTLRPSMTETTILKFSSQNKPH